MKKILLILILLSIFSINVIAVDIDIGNPAIDGIAWLNPDFTFIDLNNPANASGRIKSVELYAKETLSNCEVAIFYLVSGTNYSTRDYQAIGTVTQGAKRTFAVNLVVQTGDYIGLHFTVGTLRAGAETGSTKFRSVSGDRIPCLDYNFATTGERLISLYGTGIIPDIDIGMPAIDRGSTASTYTWVNIGNPANESGTITGIAIWASTPLTNCEVATFFVVSGNNLSTRDVHFIGDVAAGSKQTFVVDLDVEVGDYIGSYHTAGAIERDSSGFAGCWMKTGDNIPCENLEFSFREDEATSLCGTGVSIPTGWDHKWNTQTISKWNTKEIIKWNGLE